jgi:S1-C subfamily serine protease
MAVLEELTGAIERIADRVGPAVVGLGRGWGRGSGVAVAEGRVLTNAHNLRGDEVAVTFADGRAADGRVVGVDEDGDLAAIEVDTGEVEPVEWAPDDGVSTGAAVFALANPGGRGLRVTFGLVSATERSFRGPRGRRIRGSIEHTAPLPRGSSGGPLADAEGRLLGLNTVRMEGGLILAIPADVSFRDRAEALGRGEEPRRARLGVAIAPAYVARKLRRAVGLPEREGLLVHRVERGGPAARAGLRRGDLIVAAAGTSVARVDDLHDALDPSPPDGELVLTVVRGEDEREVAVTFSEAGA